MHNLYRRKSNLKNKYVKGRLPKIRKFHKRFSQLLNEPRRLAGKVVVAELQQEEVAVTTSASPSAAATQRPARDPKYGRFHLADRWDVDQVPLALVNDDPESTSAGTGNRRIVIFQPFSGFREASVYGSVVYWTRGEGDNVRNGKYELALLDEDNVLENG